MPEFDFRTPPRRKRATFLDFNEVLLLDYLALVGAVPLASLRRDRYPVFANTGYTHSLSDIQLLETVTTLAQLRLVRIHRASGLSGRGHWPRPWVVWLTPEGGSLWEQEREPDWQYYVQVSILPRVEITVTSPSAEAIQNCLRVSNECWKWHFRSQEVSWRLQWDVPLLRWKCFRKVWIATIPERRVRSMKCCNWDYHERHRTWWTHINHLPRAGRAAAE